MLTRLSSALSQVLRVLPIPGKLINPLAVQLSKSMTIDEGGVVVQSRWRDCKFIVSDVSDLIQRQLFFQGYFEYRESRLIRDYLRPGMTYVDVGANIGWHMINASARVGPSGRVFGFEPSPKAFSLATKNLELNRASNTRVFQLALGDVDGTGWLFHPDEGNSGADTLNPHASLRGADCSAHRVEIRRGDRLFAELGIATIDLIKIDVEGHEWHVLMGLREMLESARIGAILLEVNAEALGLARASPGMLESLLARYGFVCHPVRGSGAGAKLKPAGPHNVLCVHATRNACR